MARPLRNNDADALELPTDQQAGEIEREWAREARRRAETFKASGADGIPHEEVMAELRAMLE